MMTSIITACTEKKESIQVRSLPIEGAFNVRDLGGYQAANGKQVKWRKVFRSGDLNQLTENDLNYFSAIPIKTSIDFRDSAEVSASPDKEPSSLKHHFFLPIKSGSVIIFQQATPETIPLLLVDGNKSFVRNSQDVYKKFFEILMTEEDAPLLFHCSAGKDRAGFGAALFLSSLGVDRETIIQDYLLTNECLKDKYKVMVDSIPAIAPLLEARREYIQAAFDIIDQEYGGMDNYLTNYLKVDIDRMRKLYTE